MSTRLSSTAALTLLSLTLLAARNVRESFDLRPRFEEGQQLTIHSNLEGSVKLTDITLDLGGMQMPEAASLELEFGFSEQLDERVLGAEGGELHKLRRTHVAGKMSVEGEAGAMGESQDLDESDESKLVGHSFELSLDEDGDLVIEEVTESDSLEAVDEDALATMSLASHFEALLPTDEVEVGDSWDVAESAKALFWAGAESAAASEDDGADMLQFLEAIGEEIDCEATGKLTAVDGEGAHIEWTATFSISSLDLLDLMSSIAGDEMQGMPEGAQATASAELEFSGEGLFDMKTHQLRSASMKGEYSIEASMDMEQEQTAIHAAARLEGELEMEGSIELQ